MVFARVSLLLPPRKCTLRCTEADREAIHLAIHSGAVQERYVNFGGRKRAEGEKLQDQLNELEIVRISVYRPNWSEIALVQAFAVRDL